MPQDKCESGSTHHSGAALKRGLTFNASYAAIQDEERARALPLTPRKTWQSLKPEARCIIFPFLPS